MSRRLGCALVAALLAVAVTACVFAYKSNVQTAHAPKQGSKQEMSQPTAGGDDSGISGSNVGDDEKAEEVDDDQGTEDE